MLALLLGGIGAHKFYLGRIGMGILYLVFVWTFIPAIVAFVEAIIYITMSDQAFAKKYGRSAGFSVRYKKGPGSLRGLFRWFGSDAYEA